MAQTPSDLRTDADLIVRGLKGRVIHIFHLDVQPKRLIKLAVG